MEKYDVCETEKNENKRKIDKKSFAFLPKMQNISFLFCGEEENIHDTFSYSFPAYCFLLFNVLLFGIMKN